MGIVQRGQRGPISVRSSGSRISHSPGRAEQRAQLPAPKTLSYTGPGLLARDEALVVRLNIIFKNEVSTFLCLIFLRGHGYGAGRAGYFVPLEALLLRAERTA